MDELPPDPAPDRGPDQGEATAPVPTPAPTDAFGATLEQPTEVFAPERDTGRFDPPAPPVAGATPASPASPASPWASPSEGGSPWPDPNGLPPPLPSTPPIPAARPFGAPHPGFAVPIVSGTPPPAPWSGGSGGPTGPVGPPGLPSAPADASVPAAEPRPLNAVKVAVLVGIVSAAVAALVTAGVFLAVGGRPASLTSGSRSSGTDPNGGRLAGNSVDIRALLAKAQPSVVSIHVRSTTSAGVLGGAGTGMLISDDGLVLTNAHVVAGADGGRMKVTLADGSEHDALLVGSLPDDDVALIKVAGVSGLVPATLGRSDDLQVGDDVVAIGNALNLGGTPTVTEGIVSAKDRTIQDENGLTHDHLIQTDAAINPGNSGGPLLNAVGEVVGINTAVLREQAGEVQNIGFAIAIDGVIPLIEQIKQGKGTTTPDQVFLGVATRSVADAGQAELDRNGVTATRGALVEGVTPNSSASDGNLETGDVITGIDGQDVSGAGDVGKALKGKQPGDQITITYERDGKQRTTTTTLRSRADSGN